MKIKKYLLRNIGGFIIVAALIVVAALPAFTGTAKEIANTAVGSDINQKIETMIKDMTIEQKVGQMIFYAFRWNNRGKVTKVDDNISQVVKGYGLGGVALFSENIQSKSQVTEYIADLQKAAAIPLFISIDEEGGRVLRTRSLDVPRIKSAFNIGKTGNAKNAHLAAQIIANYLKPLGFNVNFAPSADVLTNPYNKVIGDRAFSSDPVKAGEMVGSFVEGSLDNGIMPALKHFPGHGHTSEDSHYGMAVTKKTLEEMIKCEFIPFKAGIDAGTTFVMTGHISTPNIGDGNTPSTFSKILLQEVLRDTLGFEGIIITDALGMGAIKNYYTSGDTAVYAILAGVDMLLMPDNLNDAYMGILKAVTAGTITEERIDESVKRILTAKYKAGLIELPN